MHYQHDQCADSTCGFDFEGLCKTLSFSGNSFVKVITMVKAKKADAKLARNKARGGTKESNNNPFEIHTNKKKHDILGRKLKHDRGLPGISRSKAIKKVS